MNLVLTNSLIFSFVVAFLVIAIALIQIGKYLERKTYFLGFDTAPVLPEIKPTKIIATYENNILEVNCNGVIRKYKYDGGNSFYELPMMQQVGAGKTLQMLDIVRYIGTYGNPYPTAHEKTTI